MGIPTCRADNYRTVRVDTERKQLEIHIPDVARRNETDIPVEIVLRDLQDGFSLVVQFRFQMAPRVVFAFDQVQNGVDVDFPFIRSPHQLCDRVSRFAGVVDVVHRIADAVYSVYRLLE